MNGIITSFNTNLDYCISEPSGMHQPQTISVQLEMQVSQNDVNELQYLGRGPIEIRPMEPAEPRDRYVEMTQKYKSKITQFLKEEYPEEFI